jgi:methylenetetrahydrofolate reductase (NADPH)
MRIVDIIREKAASRPTLSFEIFPPKPQNSFNIVQIAEELAQYSPDFISVTYGAGGSTRDKTIEVASLIKQNYGIETIAHLTCISFTKDQITATADELVANNIENVLALRGDLPTDPEFKFPTPLHFAHSSDLVAFLNSKYQFCLGGAFYPEGHTETKDLDLDLHYTLEKIESGMDYLISQVFFDNEYYYRIKTRIRELGYETPLLAGIMPILSKSQITRITQLSGCVIPPDLQKILELYGDDPEALLEAGIEYTAKQIEDLIERGVDGIHLFTMNNPKAVKMLLQRICTEVSTRQSSASSINTTGAVQTLLQKICHGSQHCS